MKSILFILSFLVLSSCTLGNCFLKKEPMDAQKTSQIKEALVKSDLTQKVKVFKEDGSRQCNEGDPIALDTMAQQLVGIKVLRSYKANDGIMRIQVCGAPTGECNVYEIERVNLAQALKLGFKEWSQD
ncbi:MAG TPA: hypothetical protein PLJ21_08440 [Pseudobdellovibrionaceae bacterium]|nr:hypothetical protein [Pseudobdellovibrionaceae bacterium]